MVKIILSLYRYFRSHHIILWSGLALLMALLMWAASQMRLKEDISAFLPKDKRSEQINTAFQHVGTANNIMINFCMADTAVEPNPDLLSEAADSFTNRLLQLDTALLVRKIEGATDMQQIMALRDCIIANMPYFLTEEDYASMDTLLSEENIKRIMMENKRVLLSPMGAMLKQAMINDPLHLSAPLMAKLKDLRMSNSFNTYNDRLFTDDMRSAIIIIVPSFASGSEKDNRLLALLDSVAKDTEDSFSGKLTISHFGASDIALANADQIKRDSILSSAIAIALIFLLLWFVFRSFRSMASILTALLFGWLFAFAILSLLKPEISLIAIGIGSIVAGIAVNYPLHFLDHLRHERTISSVIKHITPPLLIGNITTVGAFLSLAFVQSTAITDLGLFASLFLIGAICFVLVVFPHISYVKPLKSQITEKEHYHVTPLNKRLRKTGIWIILILSGVFCFLSSDTQIETNLQKINYMTEQQRRQFAEMLSLLNKDGEPVYHVSEGLTLDEALTVREQRWRLLDSLRTQGTVTAITGIGGFLPSKAMQQHRLGLWDNWWKTHPHVLPTLETESKKLGFRNGSFSAFIEMVHHSYAVQDVEFFAPITDIVSGWLVIKPNHCMVIDVLRTTTENRDAFEQQFADSHTFAFDAGTISRSLVESLSDDFNTVLYICGFIVFFFLIITMGRIELSLMAFFPLIIGWFWILGIMNIFDIRFNIVSIILATLIFGQGDDYSIFITEGLMYEYAYGKKLMKSYKNSIILSALIMFIGIGSLIIAKHPALHSLAEVIIIGMLAVVLMTFVFPPIIFNWLVCRKGRPRLIPITLVHLAATVYGFAVFLIFSAGITLCGFFLLTIGGRTDRHRLLYHRLLYRTARFVMKYIPLVKCVYENPHGESFEKPSVIICNHQSHLDLMCIMMLHPKIIILTNGWVWKSPFYGQLIRYADFYPLTDGVETIMESLKAAVNRGYSIMIFPEGTRSEDCMIQRFHKGAFHIAQQLDLDIVPVMLHGAGHLLPKRELLLRKGTIHVRVLPRITAEDSRFDTDCLVRTREVRRYYLQEYDGMASQIENAHYYADLVYHNYIYKGPAVERVVRTELKQHKHYADVIDSLADARQILVLNCGYGVFPLLLAMVVKTAKVTATDTDEDKLTLAAHCVSIPENLRYETTVSPDTYGTYDRIVVLSNTSLKEA